MSKMDNRISLHTGIPSFDKLTVEAKGINLAPNLETKFKKAKRQKVLDIDPKRPYVKARDGEAKVIERVSAIPEELKDQFSQDEWDALHDYTFESLESTYKTIKLMIEAPTKAFKELLTQDEKYKPYVQEVEKLKTMLAMNTSDTRDLVKEVNSIRKLYENFLNEDGSVKSDVPTLDAYIIEKIIDIKARYLVCTNRVRAITEPLTKHVSDFFSAMKFGYYLDHPEEAPEDVKKFINERLYQYTNTTPPTQDHIEEANHVGQ